jgi:flagella basal body P-ring formation protein FlgA
LVSEALAKEFPDADVFVDGPETITLRGAFNELDQESVLREFRTFIENRFKGRKDIRVRVDRLSMPSTIKTRPGKWTLTFPGFLPRGGDFAPEETLDQIIRRCAGSQTVEIRQQFDGSSELAPQTYWATAFMTLERELPISRRNLAAREIVAADDVELQWIPVGRGNIALAEDLSKIVGKRLRSTWNVGLPIAHAMLETPMAIKQGESIKMIVRDGAMEIQGRGRALQSGSVGQMIEVEYPATRKRVTARVIDSGMVEATF